jgi:hypothetical protein
MTMSVRGYAKVAGAVLAATLAIGIVPARADAGDEGRLLSLTNQVRSSQGVAALSIDAQLTAVAQAWAATLAERGVISHNPSVRSQVTGWQELGENVGVGGTVAAVHDGFVASPGHLANIVDPAFTKVGFGIVRPDARIFVVEVFMRPAGAAATPVTTVVVTPAVQSVPATTVPAVTVTKPAPPAPVVDTPPPAPAPAELSTWMVLSLDGLRSMEPAKAA